MVDLARWSVAAAPADATDCADLANEHGGRERAAWRGQGGEPPPAVAHRIVFVHVVGRRPALDEADDDVELVLPAHGRREVLNLGISHPSNCSRPQPAGLSWRGTAGSS
jgi:hypothetical protein